MQEQLRQIAERIKALREIQNLTPDTLAHELDISPQMYERYEQGQADIPIGFLYKLAARFNVELSALLTGDNPHLHRFAITRKGKGATTERRHQYKYQSLAANFMHKKAEPFLVTVDPHPDTEPIQHYSHPGQEFTYVIEGTLKVVIDKHEIVLEEGDSLFFDSDYRHCMRALGGRPAKFLAVII